MTQSAPVSTALATTAPVQAIAPLTRYEMTLEPEGMTAAWTLAERLAKIRFCKCPTPEEALARIMYGRTLGLSAIASMVNVHMIEDKPGTEAATLLGVCLGRTDICELFEPVGEPTATSATWVAKRAGKKEQRVTWTIEDAKTAGLAQKDNWKHYPKAMLSARCISALAKMVFPDIIKGFASTEELLDREQARTVTVTTDGEVVAVGGKPVEHANLDAELAALKAKISAAKTPDEFKALRQEVEEFPLHSAIPELRATYSEAKKKAKAAAQALAEQKEPEPATAPTDPAPAAAEGS